MQVAELRRINAGDTVGDGDDGTVGEGQRGALRNTGDLNTQRLGAVRVGERGGNRQIDWRVFNRVCIRERQCRRIRIGGDIHIDGAAGRGRVTAVAFSAGGGNSELEVGVAIGRRLDLQIAELCRVDTGDTVGDRDDGAVGERQGRTIWNTGDLHAQCLGAVRVSEGRRDTQRNRCVFNRVCITER